eukprot:CAMPEP_0171112572 /NCGR_PEP_ID=MMETSP0766_2-20121228/79534_1 /TAXON_ID=439317 /ORGANISM="Gambierdiscus australes, Strain CAWD 149" /LENGTH=235 /DNA_ID=CAMNT_0011574689 /DNA_START=1 /DNA_END=708 /DNA_ORIENTATION=+
MAYEPCLPWGAHDVAQGKRRMLTRAADEIGSGHWQECRTAASEKHANALAGHLAALAARAPDEESQSPHLRRFRVVYKPSIDISQYVDRLFAHFGCSPSCFVVAAAYLDRALRREPSMVPDGRSIHRLLLASLVSAVKFSDDAIFTNAWYAQVGGVSNRELNALEAAFLQLLDWNVYVSQEEYENYLVQLCPLGTAAGSDFTHHSGVKLPGASALPAGACHRDPQAWPAAPAAAA